MNIRSIAVLPLMAMIVLPLQAAQYNTLKIIEESAVLAAVKRVGTDVIVNSTDCNSHEYMGIFVEDHENGTSYIEICTAIHEGDTAELKDTIRHEAYHLVQSCNEGPIFTSTSIRKAADTSTISHVEESGDYPPEQFHTELEARVIAKLMDEEFIIGSIELKCL